MLENYFNYKKHKTDFKTEVIAGHIKKVLSLFFRRHLKKQELMFMISMPSHVPEVQD